MQSARISWVRPEDGGRKTLPTSTTYYATTMLPNSDAAWTVVLQFERPLGIREYDSCCQFDFLVDDAPREELRKIARLTLYEGPRKVADLSWKNETRGDLT